MIEKIEKQFVGEKGEQVIVKSFTVYDRRRDHREDSATFNQEVDILCPTIVEDHGNWKATWDRISFSQEEADKHLEELKAEHIK